MGEHFSLSGRLPEGAFLLNVLTREYVNYTKFIWMYAVSVNDSAFEFLNVRKKASRLAVYENIVRLCPQQRLFLGIQAPGRMFYRINMSDVER